MEGRPDLRSDWVLLSVMRMSIEQRNRPNRGTLQAVSETRATLDLAETNPKVA